MRIEPVTADTSAAAVALVARFFAEEGFAIPRPQIARNLADMLADGSCWAALASEGAVAVGVVTVTTMRYVEWGLLGEIGDLYVLPERRRRGIAAMLVAVGLDWCRGKGCSAVSVTITPEGEERHLLSQFYARLGFQATGRTIMSLPLQRREADWLRL
jgi:GNAT superfamily N-acetyltransferase